MPSFLQTGSFDLPWEMKRVGFVVPACRSTSAGPVGRPGRYLPPAGTCSAGTWQRPRLQLFTLQGVLAVFGVAQDGRHLGCAGSAETAPNPVHHCRRPTHPALQPLVRRRRHAVLSPEPQGRLRRVVGGRRPAFPAASRDSLPPARRIGSSTQFKVGHDLVHRARPST